jgi:adenine/guanine phosphoribosyltransferase-like PRPP-binding protein
MAPRQMNTHDDETSPCRTEPTTGYWQTLLDTSPDCTALRAPFRLSYPVRLPNGRLLVLPLRALPDGNHAVASLIANQASFTVVDALADAMTSLARAAGVGVILGMPTLGLTFAPLVAQRLGYQRYAPLGYSRKYWYDAALSEPVSSITSPDDAKRLYLDPNLVPLLAGQRVCIVDDAVSTGASILAAYRLLARLGIEIAAIVVAMKQSTRWQAQLAAADKALPGSLRAVFGCPLFARGPDGWMPIDGSLPALP